MEITIRPETEEDYKDITGIHDLAFNRGKEGVLVERLRKTASFISDLSLVAEYKNRIIGRILFYPIKINAGTRKCDSLALAPVAVHPNYQKRGIGSKMIEKGLTMAKKLGFKSVIVVGHPEYYPRFGFAAASKWEIRAPFNVPEDAFLAFELTRNGLENCRGTVEYPREFDDLWETVLQVCRYWIYPHQKSLVFIAQSKTFGQLRHSRGTEAFSGRRARYPR